MTERIIQCAIAVHQEMGPRFVEKVYQNAMMLELIEHGLKVEAEKEICIYYGGRLVGRHRPDLLAPDKVIVENKAIFIPLSPSQKRSIP